MVQFNYTKLQFPYYLQRKQSKVAGYFTIDTIYLPSDPVQVGDIVRTIEGSHTVIGVSNERPAKGEYGPFVEEGQGPVMWCQLECVFNPPTETAKK